VGSAEKLSTPTDLQLWEVLRKCALTVISKTLSEASVSIARMDTLHGHEVLVTLRGTDFASVKTQVEQASQWLQAHGMGQPHRTTTTTTAPCTSSRSSASSKTVVRGLATGSRPNSAGAKASNAHLPHTPLVERGACVCLGFFAYLLQ